ncbi:MAG: peroxiredoxin family protein [Gemmataceae bacterium]
MHAKYQKEGLEVITVTLDDPQDAKTRERVNKLLTEKLKAGFINLNMDPKSVDWEKKLGFEGVPGVVVFNRDTRLVRKWPTPAGQGKEAEEVDYEAIEKVIQGLLKK